jgi:zinc protease
LPRSAVLALAFLLLAALFSGQASARVFNPETFTLANGMQVVVVPNHRVPVVTHMVWYKVGAADEPAGRSGIAHFLEHLMFKGTKTLGPGEYSRILARNGGRENAFTSADYTAYFQTVALDRLELVMKMEADRMTNLVLTEKEVEPERLVILEERRQRIDNNPSSRLREIVDATLFLNHPYRIPVIGWEHEIRGLKLDDILSFYRHNYAPNNAILVVAGDITAAKLRPLAEKYYGVIPAVPRGPRVRTGEPPNHASRQVVLRDARVRQPAWSRSFLAPGYLVGATEHAYALEVLSEILSGGATSRLYRALVVEGKLAVSAGAMYDPDGLGPSRFVFYASPRPGVTMETLAGRRRHRGRGRAGPQAHAGPGRLRPGFPRHRGADPGRGPGLRAHRRGRRGLARTHRRRHRRAGQRRRPCRHRPGELGDRPPAARQGRLTVAAQRIENGGSLVS